MKHILFFISLIAICSCTSDIDNAYNLVNRHSRTITMNAFLSGFDYALPFAVDITGEVTALAGGSALLPQTLVINGRGEVIYNQAGSVTRELLEDLLKQAQESMADAPGSGGRPEGSNTGEVQDGA